MLKQEKIVLGDSKEYLLTEYDVGDFIEINKKYGTIEMQQNNMEQMMFWLWLSIKKENDMKIEDMYHLIQASFISSGGMEKIFQTLAKLNGWNTDSKNDQSLAGKSA